MPRFLANHPLQALNTLAIPALARYYCEVTTLDELDEARAFARDRRLPLVILGGGSNVVLGSRVDALVVRFVNQSIHCHPAEAGFIRLSVGAGQNWHQLVRHSLQHNWYGLENLALIPGSAGAAPIQNIGAYGVELERVLRGVHAVELATGERVRFGLSDCELGYRDSVFKGRYRDRFAIHAIELDLTLVPDPVLDYPALRQALEEDGVTRPTPMDVFEAVCRVRRDKLPDPGRVPNAGSFFKNPVVSADKAATLADRYPDLACYPVADGRVKLAAAWLIDRAGWKGRREGGVAVHDRQALVLCNPGRVGSDALLQLAHRVAASVREQFGVELEMEPRCYGCEL